MFTLWKPAVALRKAQEFSCFGRIGDMLVNSPSPSAMARGLGGEVYACKASPG